MCLTVQKRYHHLNKNSARAITTKRPIVVWKCLNKVIDRDGVVGGRSPYFNFLYQFGELVTTKVVQYKDRDWWNTRFEINVYQGLHAYVRSPISKVCGVYPALIPTGSKILLGDNNDVVSNQLIVFLDLPALMSYCGVDKLGKPFSRKLLSNKRRGKKAAR